MGDSAVHKVLCGFDSLLCGFDNLRGVLIFWQQFFDRLLTDCKRVFEVPMINFFCDFKI